MSVRVCWPAAGAGAAQRRVITAESTGASAASVRHDRLNVRLASLAVASPASYLPVHSLWFTNWQEFALPLPYPFDFDC